jgi:hypothetical protein
MRFTDCPRKSIFRLGHRDQMNMIRHQAVGEDLQTVLFGITLQQLKVAQPVSSIEEHILPAIATLGNMVGDASHHGSRHPGH